MIDLRIRPGSQAASWLRSYKGERDTTLPLPRQTAWFECYMEMCRIKDVDSLDLDDGELRLFVTPLLQGKFLGLSILREGTVYWIV